MSCTVVSIRSEEFDSTRFTTRAQSLRCAASSCPHTPLLRKKSQHLRRHPEAQKDGSAAPRGLDARHRLVGPRPQGALTVCESLAFCGVCLTPHARLLQRNPVLRRDPPRAATMAPPVLLVVLHGEAFRFDGQLSRDASADLSSQLEMLNALQRNVLQPAACLGWVVQCVAHLSYTARTGSTRNVRSLLAALQRLQVYPVNIQPAASAAACKEATQLPSMMRALQWSARTTAKLPKAQAWAAMLLIRADLVTTHPLPLPPAAASGCEVVLAPNQMKTSTADPDACDWPERPGPNASHCTRGGLWYVPRCRYHDFRKNLSTQSQFQQQQRQQPCTTG